MHYHASPARRCFAPGRSFRHLGNALRFAQEASQRFRVPYAVWRSRDGRLRLLKRFPAIPPAA